MGLSLTECGGNPGLAVRVAVGSEMGRLGFLNKPGVLR